MSIAALFTAARTWKQPKCPSTDEWVKKVWHAHTHMHTHTHACTHTHTHTHTLDYYSAIKREWN